MRLPVTQSLDTSAGISARGIPQGWRGSEIRYLRGHAREGAAAIAAHLSALRASEKDPRSALTVKAVTRQAERMRIALRRPGSRRGRMLGQPRGESWAAGPSSALRQAALEGALDLTLAEGRIAAEVSGQAPVCPSCGMRPAWHTKTGLCVVCHKKRLAEQLRQQTSEAEAERDYQSAKQQAHRAKVCAVEGCDHVANGTGGMCWTHTRARREGTL